MDRTLVQVVYLVRDCRLNLFIDVEDTLSDIGSTTQVFHSREDAKSKIVELECAVQERSEYLEIIQLLV
jgi:hypothetical protein